MVNLIIALIIILISAFGWAIGGNIGGQWRWMCVAVPLTIFALFKIPLTLTNIFYITIIFLLIWGAIATGYGKTAPVYLFWTKFYEHQIANLLTRATLGLLYGGSVGLFCFLMGHWWLFPISIIMATINNIYWNCIYKPLPLLFIFGFYINMTEFMTGLGVGIAGIIALL